MRFPNFGLSVSIALTLLCASASFAGAQVAVWGSAGLGAASFDGAAADPMPTTLVEGWLAVGAVAFGRRRVDAGFGGVNTTERIDNAWLVGAHRTFGRLMLVAGAGQATVSGRNSNGEQSGTTTPIARSRGLTAEGELSYTLGHYFGLGVATFRTGGSRAPSWGAFFVAQLGRLR